MRNQNLINKLEIYRLVKNHFCLADRSLSLFKHRLFYEPNISPMYKKILGDSKDLRKKILLHSDFYANFDEGWKEFRNYFAVFAMKTEITYKQFSENKVVYKKQEYKIKKALVDFYKNNIFFAIRDFTFNVEVKQFLFPSRQTYNKIGDEYITIFNKDKTILKKITFQEISKNKEMIKLLEGRILKILEQVGAQKLPNKKLYIVLSLNFADWFLCSTAENWSSCLNLESHYDEAFWTGLPGLVADKNRAMIYITDGKKKEYEKIKVDKILTRSWILAAREKKTNKEFFHAVREYPLSYNLKTLAEKYFGMKFTDNNFVGRHYIELIYHNISSFDDSLSYTYQDTTNICIAKKNKAKYFPNRYGYLKSGGSGSSDIAIDKKTGESYFKKGFGFRYGNGLSSLAKDGLKCYFCDFEEEEEEEGGDEGW